MDTQTAALIALAILALVALAFFQRYRHRAKVGLKGLGAELSLEGEDRQDPSTQSSSARSGISMEGVKSRAGGVHAEDRHGQGISMKDVDTHGDVRAVSGSDPKAQPPA